MNNNRGRHPLHESCLFTKLTDVSPVVVSEHVPGTNDTETLELLGVGFMVQADSC